MKFCTCSAIFLISLVINEAVFANTTPLSQYKESTHNYNLGKNIQKHKYHTRAINKEVIKNKIKSDPTHINKKEKNYNKHGINTFIQKKVRNKNNDYDNDVMVKRLITRLKKITLLTDKSITDNEFHKKLNVGLFTETSVNFQDNELENLLSGVGLAEQVQLYRELVNFGTWDDNEGEKKRLLDILRIVMKKDNNEVLSRIEPQFDNRIQQTKAMIEHNPDYGSVGTIIFSTKLWAYSQNKKKWKTFIFGSTGHCSGVLIAQDKVLTNGHCLKDVGIIKPFDIETLRLSESYEGVYKSMTSILDVNVDFVFSEKIVEFVPGSTNSFSVEEVKKDEEGNVVFNQKIFESRESSSDGKIKTSEIIVDPEFLENGRFSDDIAILILASPLLNVQPLPLRQTSAGDLPEGTNITTIGYPGDKHLGTQWKSKCQLLNLYPHMHVLSLLFHNCRTVGGASGSPILDSSSNIIGLNSGVEMGSSKFPKKQTTETPKQQVMGIGTYITPQKLQWVNFCMSYKKKCAFQTKKIQKSKGEFHDIYDYYNAKLKEHELDNEL
eukprot:Pgem_evm1s38